MTPSLAVISVKASDLQPGDQLFRRSNPNFDVAFVSQPYDGQPSHHPLAGIPAAPGTQVPVVTVTFGSGSQQELRADSSLMIFRPREGHWWLHGVAGED
jgi:hypothetical protein